MRVRIYILRGDDFIIIITVTIKYERAHEIHTAKTDNRPFTYCEYNIYLYIYICARVRLTDLLRRWTVSFRRHEGVVFLARTPSPPARQ